MKKSTEAILADSRRYLDIVGKTDLEDEEQAWIVQVMLQNFNQYVNPGFLEYRKSVSDDYTAVEWLDYDCRFRDVHGKEYIDCLGGFGTHNAGYRHPAILGAVKAQLDRQAIHSQEILDPFRGMLAHRGGGDRGALHGRAAPPAGGPSRHPDGGAWEGADAGDGVSQRRGRLRGAHGLWRRGVLVAGTLLNARVIRMEPPLTMPRADVDLVLERLEDTLKSVRLK
ncbi:MAG: aminotransferase class III-fold pyridoxal phosphate-dependent enzyme [Candidatus Xenobia bacterium]